MPRATLPELRLVTKLPRGSTSPRKTKLNRVPEMLRMSSGRRPNLSESRPMTGAAINWARAFEAISAPTRVALAPSAPA